MKGDRKEGIKANAERVGIIVKGGRKVMREGGNKGGRVRGRKGGRVRRRKGGIQGRREKVRVALANFIPYLNDVRMDQLYVTTVWESSKDMHRKR